MDECVKGGLQLFRTEVAMPHEDEMLQRLFSEEALSHEEEMFYIERLIVRFPSEIGNLIKFYAQKKQRLEAGLKESKEIHRKQQYIISKLTAMPWYSGTVIRKDIGIPDKVIVAVGPSQMALECADGIEPDDLEIGQKVLVSQEKNCVIDIDLGDHRCKEIGVVEEFHRDYVIVKVREMESIPLTLACALRDTPLKTGDRVLYDGQLGLAYEVLPQKVLGTEMLEEAASDVTLDMIGGMDDILYEICDEIVMHLLYPEVCRRHNMRPAKGILLISPPGNGKTMLAKGLLNFVKDLVGTGQVKFLSLPPGAHRHWLYGMSDQILINIFKSAREFTQNKGNKVIIFMDELDNWGRRSNDMGNTIDSRVMGTLLAQIDGLNDAGDILLIGAANRADDMLDTALTRPGRFGDNVFRIPRPDREAARAIFSKYLTTDLLYLNSSGMPAPQEAREQFIDAAVSRIFAPAGPMSKVATLVLRQGARRHVRAADLISGACIENIVRKAKYASCRRAIKGMEGILLEDLLDAVNTEIHSAAQALKWPRNARDILNLSSDLDFRVEYAANVEAPEVNTYRWVQG